MKRRNRNILMTAILVVVSAASLGANAADQSVFFDQQRQISDGYYPQYTVKDTSRSQRPEADAAEAIRFKHQMAKGTGDSYELTGPGPRRRNRWRSNRRRSRHS